MNSSQRRDVDDPPKSILPEKLSEIFLVATKDLEKCANDTETYLPTSWAWHQQSNDRLFYSGSWPPSPTKTQIEQHGNRCLVCHAGAVLAQTFNHDPMAEADPNDPETVPYAAEGDLAALKIIDLLREGHIEAAFEERQLTPVKPSLIEHLEVVHSQIFQNKITFNTREDALAYCKSAKKFAWVLASLGY